MTSWPSLKTDLKNAGADWVDQVVVNDRGLVTSRSPDDLAAFNTEIIKLFGSGAPTPTGGLTMVMGTAPMNARLVGTEC